MHNQFGDSQASAFVTVTGIGKLEIVLLDVRIVRENLELIRLWSFVFQ